MAGQCNSASTVSPAAREQGAYVFIDRGGAEFPVSSPAEAAREALPEGGGRAVAEVYEGGLEKGGATVVVSKITANWADGTGTASRQTS